MLDACLPNSFFTRDKDQNILGMDSFLGWHSECSGAGQAVMMINSHHKLDIDYDEQLGRFGAQVLELDEVQQQNPELYADPADEEQARRQTELRQQRRQQLQEHAREHEDDGQGQSPARQGEGRAQARKEADMQLSFEVTYEVFE